MAEMHLLHADDVELVQPHGHDVAELLADPTRLDAASAFVLRRDDHAEPFYYVFDRDDFEELLERLRREHRDLGDLTQAELFDYLDAHEHTRSRVVRRGARPPERAVVLDDAGNVEGVWADEPPGRAMAEPPVAAAPSASRRPVPRNGGGGRGAAPRSAGARRRAAPPRGGGATSPRRTRRARGRRKDVDRVWRRTPHVDLSTRDKPLAARQAFEAVVHLNTEASSADEETTGVEVELPNDLTTLDFEVELGASAHFKIKGAKSKPLSVHVDDEQSPKVRFELEVVARPPANKPAWVEAFFTYHDRPSGSVRRRVALEGAGLPVAAAAQPVPVLEVDAWAKAADLNVRVRINPKQPDGRHFLVKLSTPRFRDPRLTAEKQWNLDVDTETYVARLMEQFTLGGATSFARQLSLRGAGNEFWDDAPDAFKKLFWKLLDQDPPLRTISIVSEEPSIPWELMCPENADGSRRDPLGVEFVVGRFVDRRLRLPQQQAPVDDSYVIAPTYRPVLPNSASETRFVCKSFDGTRIDPATHEGMEQFFAKGGVGLVHVIAHGEAAPGQDQALRLDRGAVFFANQVGVMPKLGTAFQEKTPLVFLNACEVGRSSPTLIGVGGFAQAFIASGARGVVAPIWSVDDTIAHEVAIEFYKQALADRDRPFADILREIRAKAYAPGGEDTYAAYCWYGDPETALGPAPP